MPARERFILRSLSPVRTVAGGAVLDPAATRQRRRAPGTLARLVAISAAEPACIVAGELARRGIAGAGLAWLARIAGLSPARAAALLPAGAVLSQGEAIDRAALNQLCAQVPKALQALPQGVARARLQALVPGAGPAVLDEAVTVLIAAGVLTREGAGVRISTPDRDRAASARADADAGRIAETVRLAGLTPPDLAEIAPDVQRRRLVARLVRDGILIRAPDAVQKRELFFHRDAVDAARRHLAATLGGDGKLVGEIGAALGISRKFSVPLLEYLDSVQFTRRIAERRVLATPR